MRCQVKYERVAAPFNGLLGHVAAEKRFDLQERGNGAPFLCARRKGLEATADWRLVRLAPVEIRRCRNHRRARPSSGSAFTSGCEISSYSEIADSVAIQ